MNNHLNKNLHRQVTWIVILLAAVPFISEVVSQNGNLQSFQDLQNRVYAINQANINYQNQINNLNNQLQGQISREASDIAQAQAVSQALSNQLAALTNRVTTNERAIVDSQNQIMTLESGLENAVGRIDNLESVNKVWRSNFQVVNRTFTELRKRVQFSVPFIRFPIINQIVRG